MEILSGDMSFIERMDREFDEKIYKRARLLRKEYASQYIHIFKENVEFTISEMFQAILERKPFQNTLLLLQFNIELTEHLCEEILAMEVDLLEKIALYVAVIELGSREFIHPDHTDKIEVHLGAAKRNGYFFTPPSLAIRMVIEARKRHEHAKSVFDPACGAGILLAYQMLLNADVDYMVGVEIDEFTAIFARKLLEYVSHKLGRKTKICIYCSDFFDYVDKHEEAFDLIIMNPPYGNLKFLKSDLTDASTRADLSDKEHKKLQEKLKFGMMGYSARLKTCFKSYGMSEGTLEYSKLFLSAAHRMISNSGFIVAITPSSWLGDKASTDFRKAMLTGGYIHELWIFPEMAKLFQGVNQATVVSVLGRKKSSSIAVSNPVIDIKDITSNQRVLNLQSILAVSGSPCRFPLCDENSLILLFKIQKHGTLKDIGYVINARGELDLTIYRKYISVKKTAHRLIRGDHIRGWELVDAEMSNKAGYVDYEGFCSNIQNSAKKKAIDMERIAIPQCSYLQKKKRIEAAMIPRYSIIGNSCNYLAIEDDMRRPMMLEYYWAWANSYVVEWLFRIFSYNNHVANRELASIPCVPFEKLDDKIMENIKEALKDDPLQRMLQLNAVIAKTLSITAREYEEILSSLNAEDKSDCVAVYKNMFGE